MVDPPGVPVQARPRPATPESEVLVVGYPRLELPVWLPVAPLTSDDRREPRGPIADARNQPGIPVPVFRLQDRFPRTEPHSCRNAELLNLAP